MENAWLHVLYQYAGLRGGSRAVQGSGGPYPNATYGGPPTPPNKKKQFSIMNEKREMSPLDFRSYIHH